MCVLYIFYFSADFKDNRNTLNAIFVNKDLGMKEDEEQDESSGNCLKEQTEQ